MSFQRIAIIFACIGMACIGLGLSITAAEAPVPLGAKMVMIGFIWFGAAIIISFLAILRTEDK